MILYRYLKPGWQAATIGVGTDAGLVPLTSRDGFRAIQSWAELIEVEDLAAKVERAMDEGVEHRVDVTWDGLADQPDPAHPHLLPPIDRQEVWGAGVTYLISREERMKESETAADVYHKVYDAERPELFFKSTPDRVVAPGGQIRVRPDSQWTVPEPELTVLCNRRMEIVGYSLGNDVSARDIEGENPLYLPQAKIYDGACAIGPGMRLHDGEFDPLAQTLAAKIERDGQVIWEDSAETGRLKRSLSELVDCLGRELSFPSGVALLTGTCLVPPETLSLQPGDAVELALTGVGVLRHWVA